MKGSRKNGKKWIVIVLSVCLVFVIGIGAGILISGKTAKGTGNTSSKDVAQNGNDTIKDDVVDKEKDDKESDDASKDEKKEQTNSRDDAEIKNQDNQTNTSQNPDNNGQPDSSDNTGTYDASIPADDTAVHRYEYILDDCTWQEAFENCINKGGYLVRINSSQEYQAIRKEISSRKMTDIYFRLGGRRDSQSQDYYWVNEDNKLFGEKLNSDSSWCSAEWMQGEPSYKDGSLEERYMDLFFFDGEKRFVWNDVPDDMLAAEPAYSGKVGYICEYED